MQRVVLAVDDNEINRLNLKLLLQDHYQVLEAGDVAQAEARLADHRVDLIILDLALPPEPDNPEIGMQYLTRLRQETPDTPVIVITGHDEHALAVRARKLGAVDFFSKPFAPEEVRDTVDRAMESRWNQLREEELARQLHTHTSFDLIGESAPMMQLRKWIEHVAAAPSTVLIRGETGSGKELVARHLHQQGTRKTGPFIAVNCVSIDANHLESDLFGHEKGAFPGAVSRKLGWFEQASGGTLFLDEIAGLPFDVQGKLLRVLESGEFSRMGGEAVLNADIRLICSSKQALEQLVEQNKFRDDLYYRIHVVSINVPALREHVEDIPLLAMHFLQRKALLCNKQIHRFTDQAMAQLKAYAWPGNVRELSNVIEHAVVLTDQPCIEHLPLLFGPRIQESQEDPLDAWFARLPKEGVDADALLEMFEKRLLQLAMTQNKHIKIKAGRWLGFGDKAKDKMRYLCEKYRVHLET